LRGRPPESSYYQQRSQGNPALSTDGSGIPAGYDKIGIAPKRFDMTTVTVAEAQATLGELIHRLVPGEELLITENNRPVAKLIIAPPPRNVRQLGTLRGTVLSMKQFDDPLEEFEEYR
jgi:prevent-host-death family protein